MAGHVLVSKARVEKPAKRNPSAAGILDDSRAAMADNHSQTYSGQG